MLVALRVPGVDVHDVIQVHRRQVVELMQQWTRIKEDETEFDLPFALVVDAELTRLAAVTRWLDLADEHVKRAGNKTVGTASSEAQAQGGGPAMSFLELHKVSKSYGEGSTLVHALADITCRSIAATSWR